MARGERRPKKTRIEATEAQVITHIPTDLLEEILVRLPATDLQNFKSVCKDWLRLISSPQFIRKHLNRSTARRDVTRILMPSLSAIIDYNYFANGSNISKEIQYPPGFTGENAMILGSYDGLICLLNPRSLTLTVFNPSTGKSDIRIIDRLDITGIRFYWFGRHPSTGEYVLVIGRFLYEELEVTIEVHKFSGELKFLRFRPIRELYLCCQKRGTLLHGHLHWPAYIYDNGIATRQLVLAYDFQKDNILEISAPRQSPDFTLGVKDGCLCAVFRCKETFELWIMKEYGVENSWIKYRNIEGYDKCTVLFPLGFSQNGDLILDADRSKLMKYNFNEKKSTLLKIHKSHLVYSTAIVCDDSLLSPAPIEEGNLKTFAASIRD